MELRLFKDPSVGEYESVHVSNAGSGFSEPLVEEPLGCVYRIKRCARVRAKHLLLSSSPFAPRSRH